MVGNLSAHAMRPLLKYLPYDKIDLDIPAPFGLYSGFPVAGTLSRFAQLPEVVEPKFGFDLEEASCTNVDNKPQYIPIACDQPCCTFTKSTVNGDCCSRLTRA